MGRQERVEHAELVFFSRANQMCLVIAAQQGAPASVLRALGVQLMND